MGKPNYRVIVSYDRDRNVFSARAPELTGDHGHLSAEGASRAAAIAALEVEIDAQLANMLSHGTTPPKAVDDTEYAGEYGEIKARISRGLHRDLCLMARSDGLEVDQLISELLASAYTARQGARSGGRAQQRQALPADAGDDIGNRVDHHPGHHPGPRGDGNRRGGFQRGGYGNHIMDDRANFIEYVRGLEHAGGQGNGHNARGHGGGHGGGGHGGGGHNNNNRGRRRGGRGGGPPGGGGRDGNRTHGHHGGGGHGHGQGNAAAPVQGAGAPHAAGSGPPGRDSPGSTEG